MEQVENRISGIKEKADEVDQSDKNKEEILRKYKWIYTTSDTIKRPNL
jgi:hypothetical protein